MSFGRRPAAQGVPITHNLSAYDAAYVALAEALNCALLTRDVRLAKASGHLVTVVIR